MFTEREKKCKVWWLVKFLGHEKTGWFSMEKSSQAELCYSLLWAAPRNFPLCVHAENMKKLTKGSNLHSRNITWALPGTGTDAGAEHSPSLHCNVQATSGDRAVWKASQLGGEIRLCSPSNTGSWPGSVLTAELQKRSWDEAETPGSLMRACYSCNPGSAWVYIEKKAFLTNWFTEVLNWRQARIQSI